MNHTTQYPVHSVCLLAECHVRRWRGQRWHYYSQEGWQTANRSLSHTDIFKESCGHFQWFFWRPKLTILSQEVGPPPVTKTDILTQTMFFSPLRSVVCASAQAEHKHSIVWGEKQKSPPKQTWKLVLYFTVCASFLLYISFCYVMSPQSLPSNSAHSATGWEGESLAPLTVKRIQADFRFAVTQNYNSYVSDNQA